MLGANHDGQESSRLSFREQAPFAARGEGHAGFCRPDRRERNQLNS